MHRSLIAVVLPLGFALALTPACHRHRAADAPPPPPAEAVPPPPPPPCDLVGSWKAQPPLPLGPQEVDVAPGDRPGVFLVRAKNGTNVGVATVQTNTGVPVDTSVTNPFYRCAVGPDCNTMTCAFTGGAAPATFTRIQ